MEVVFERLREEVVDVGARLADLAIGAIEAIVIIVVARYVARWLRHRVRTPLFVRKVGVNVAALAENVVAAFTYVIALTLVLAVFGVSSTAVVTYLSVVSVAISLSLQDLFKNVVAGVYLLIERPFSIGERIRIRDINGVVERIDLRTTVILSVTGEQVLVPNALIFTDVVTNRSASQSLRVQFNLINLPGPSGQAESKVKDVLATVNGILSPAPEIMTVGVSENGVSVAIDLWYAPNYPVRSEVIALMREAFPESEITSVVD